MSNHEPYDVVAAFIALVLMMVNPTLALVFVVGWMVFCCSAAGFLWLKLQSRTRRDIDWCDLPRARCACGQEAIVDEQYNVLPHGCNGVYIWNTVMDTRPDHGPGRWVGWKMRAYVPTGRLRVHG